MPMVYYMGFPSCFFTDLCPVDAVVCSLIAFIPKILTNCVELIYVVPILVQHIFKSLRTYRSKYF